MRLEIVLLAIESHFKLLLILSADLIDTSLNCMALVKELLEVTLVITLKEIVGMDDC